MAFINNGGGQFLASEMVDYARFLQPSANEEYSIRDLLRSQPAEERSINQTRHEPTRYRPITVSVPTQLSGYEQSQKLGSKTITPQTDA